jgi:acyl-CoA synthetase (AMP-forming)/AMP-acid ligase II
MGVRGVVDVVEAVATADPERTALIIAGEATTYAELRRAVGHCQAGLQHAGVGAGMRIPLVDDCSVTAVATVVGAARLGAAGALMNPRLTAAELGSLLEVSMAAAIGVAVERYAGTLRAAGCATVLGPAELLAGVADPADPGSPDPDAEAVVLFTSGTTGRPKPIPFTHGVLGPRIAAFAPTFHPGDAPVVSLMCVPLVHVGGLLGLLVTLARGHTAVVQTRFDAGEWLALVARHRVNTSFLVPTMLHRILEHPDFASTDLRSLQSLTYGAAPAPPELIRRAMAALPAVAFSNVFGQTETLGSITALGPDDHGGEKLASVGRPLPGVEIAVMDPGNGDPVAPGSVGELWVKTVASVLPPAPPEGPGVPPGWLRTGDMVRVDADGYLYPAGRLSDTINRGGEKFAPIEVESILREHPAVRDVAVTGVDDPEMGNRVGAAVVLSGAAAPDELKEFCVGRLANFKLPEKIVIVDEIPYNDFGKVARAELRALFVDVPD